MSTGYEYHPCPRCGDVNRVHRLARASTTCTSCNASLRFSAEGQRRLLYVGLIACAFGPTAWLVGSAFGALSAAVTAAVGTISALLALVWQGRVPQLEIAGDS